MPTEYEQSLLDEIEILKNKIREFEESEQCVVFLGIKYNTVEKVFLAPDRVSYRIEGDERDYYSEDKNRPYFRRISKLKPGDKLERVYRLVRSSKGNTEE